MSAVLLRIVCCAAGMPDKLEGQYLRYFDPDGHDGMGTIICTEYKHEAMNFIDAHAALTLWRKQSTVRPLRDDGRPNRPLTAYTCELVKDRVPKEQ